MPLSPLLLIASAGALLDGARGEHDTERLAKQFLGELDHTAPAGRWNAAFIHHAGYWSHFEHHIGRSAWPLPPALDCHELGAFAEANGVLSAGKPEFGEVFLLWSPLRKRFLHTGIILAAEPLGAGTGAAEAERYECHTMEGNITHTGCVGGSRLARVRRILSPARHDRTIRWMDLEPRAVATRSHQSGSRRIDRQGSALESLPSAA